MIKAELIKEIVPKSQKLRFIRKWILNKYTVTVLIFFAWMVFFDNTSFLVINDLNNEINKYEEQLTYYRTEYQKNDNYYKKLMTNKEERQKFARENYFMKKPNEEIFIIVADSAKAPQK
jgi:cell division protein FtsB